MHTPLHRRLARTFARTLIGFGTFASLASLASAQETTPPPPTPTSPTSTTTIPTTTVVELADTPLDVPGLNLTVRMPVGAVAETSGVGTDSRLTVRSSEDPKKVGWLLQVFGSASRNASLTAKEVLDSIVEQRQSAQTAVNPATRRRMAVRPFDRDDKLIINGKPASRVYLDVPEANNLPSAGYTVFMPTPGQFVIFQFDCPTGNFAEARPVIETAIATTTFRNLEVENTLRRHGLEEGRLFLASLTREQIEAALPSEPVLFRVFRPGVGPGGEDLEVGYQKVTLRKGQMGEVGGADKTKWTRDDREFGLLVKIEARGLVFAPGAVEGAAAGTDQPPPQAVVDSVTVFWQSDDRSFENGSVVNVVKKDDKSETFVQTIVRRGERMTVQTTGPGQEPRTKDYDKLPDGYISRVDLTLLPRLVAQRPPTPESELLSEMLFNFYTFEFSSGKMALRRDEFRRLEPSTGGKEPPGWDWLSMPYEAQKDRRVTAKLDHTGAMITREADGVRTEPADGPTLMRLWQDRKLPIE
ncbi:MAG: hypothetical protein ACKVZJ_01235 [Phycisphaerales bacterium]